MTSIPADEETDLLARVRRQIALEVAGDVHALYEFTMPSIRERHVAEPARRD